MVTLKCTRKLLKRVGGQTVDEPAPSTSALGDWYANVISTGAGELVVFANEETLLSVAVPAADIGRLVPVFVQRVLGLLDGLRIDRTSIESEAHALERIEFARTSSRRILGSLNDISVHYQWFADGRHRPSGFDLFDANDLFDAEQYMARLPHGPHEYRLPIEVARKLLTQPRAIKKARDQK